MNTPELIEAIRTGNAEAQKIFFALYAKRMMALCVRYIGDWHEAEDKMLCGFQKFFRSVHSFSYKDERSLTAYLKKIMVNECLMFLRKKKRIVFEEITETEMTVGSENILDKLAADEIFKLIAKLPDGYRTVFNLFVIEDKSHKEISMLLGIEEGTSKSQLNKARKILQQLLLKNEYTGKR